MFNSNNQNGFAIIYGLVVLFLTTIGGMTFLYLSGKDKESSGNYLQMRDATFASKAAHNAFINLCESNPKFLIEVLDSFSSGNNSPYKWLFGNTIEKSKKENKVKLWDSSGAPAFSVKITDYNPLRFIVKIEALGYGSLGGQKKSYGIYKLNGLKHEKTIVPSHALYLGGGFGNLDAPIEINGDVFAGNGSHINSSGKIIVHGNFKTGTERFNIDGSLIVYGKSFFRASEVLFQGNKERSFKNSVGFLGSITNHETITVNGALLLNGSVKNNSTITVDGNLLSNSNISGNPIIVKNNNVAHYVTGACDPNFINATEKIPIPTPINIVPELQMRNIDDTPPIFQNDLEKYICDNGGTIYNSPENAGINFNTNGWNLESAYSSSSKWNDFLVVKVSDNMNLNSNGGTFNQKMIWIIDGVQCVARNWYSSGDNSNTLIYLKNGANLEEFNFGDNNKFRGVIYCNRSNKKTIYKFGNNSTFYGSIVHSGSDGIQFQANTIPFKIKYDKDIAGEFMDLGIFSDSNLNPNEKPIVLLKDIQIRPHLISLLY